MTKSFLVASYSILIIQIYIRASCPDGYKDDEIKAKCDAASAATYDATVYVNPVTNQQKRITYANAYCAICNDDTNYERWSLLAGCGEIPESYLKSVSTTSESTSKIAPSSTPKPDNGKVSVKLHFNPGAVLGGDKAADSGINKEINLPTFGLGKAINKTIGSNTGLFGVKIGRSRRDTAPDIDYNKYASQVDDILKTVKYDANAQRFIANYNGKKFDCKFDFRKPNDQYLRKCVHTLISECPAGQSDANALCQSYTAVVYEKSTKKAYRNKDCALCNGVAKENTTGCPVTTRSEGSSLFSTSSKSVGDAGCSDDKVAAKFC